MDDKIRQYSNAITIINRHRTTVDNHVMKRIYNEHVYLINQTRQVKRPSFIIIDDLLP